jgi:hypothetical protein
MEIKKLKSALKSQTALLSASALVFGILVVIAGTSHLVFWVLVYLAYAAYLRLKFSRNEELKPNILLTSFIVLALSSVWISESGITVVAVATVSAVLMFIFLGSQLFYFSNSKSALSVFYHSVIFGIAAYFASIAPFDIWWGAMPLIFYVIYGCTRDYLKLETGGFDRRKKIYSLIFAFLALQCIWITSLLPFGFLNAGALVLIFSITATDLFLHHSLGKLTKDNIIRNLSFLVVLIILIFLASSI